MEPLLTPCYDLLLGWRYKNSETSGGVRNFHSINFRE